MVTPRKIPILKKKKTIFKEIDSRSSLLMVEKAGKAKVKCQPGSSMPASQAGPCCLLCGTRPKANRRNSSQAPFIRELVPSAAALPLQTA